ncbi:hypothetical protein [Absicoccus intestinalis]|uniref:BppU N-terminal domain-containing protein n=1 Tax=Absicoccus intestinalis TaxID=2926319 RepID=A0ABU4WL15_9FIRM|nr:hypothetical protein [Absicoccus sp. CLA-KB-P134]MDX8416949.1 hypothetical protein [Absicoccus sp. CLA-KB-P134]
MLNAKAESTAYKVITQDDLDVQTTTVSGDGMTIKLYKSGNVVNADINKIGNVSKSGYNSTTVVIPEGYRPIFTQRIFYLGIAGSGRSGDGFYVINTDGTITNFSTTTGAIERIVTASWITSGGVLTKVLKHISTFLSQIKEVL